MQRFTILKLVILVCLAFYRFLIAFSVSCFWLPSLLQDSLLHASDFLPSYRRLTSFPPTGFWLPSLLQASDCLPSYMLLTAFSLTGFWLPSLLQATDCLPSYRLLAAFPPTCYWLPSYRLNKVTMCALGDKWRIIWYLTENIVQHQWYIKQKVTWNHQYMDKLKSLLKKGI